jgi:hypothetical protein
LGLYDSPEKSKRANSAELAHLSSGVAPTAGEKLPWLKLMRYREAWAYFSTAILGPVWWFYGFWLPDFFHKQFHLDLKHFGLPLAFVATAAALGSIGGGILSASFLRRGWSVNRARKTASFICAVCTLPVILAPYVSSPWLAAAFFGLASAAHQGWSATMGAEAGVKTLAETSASSAVRFRMVMQAGGKCSLAFAYGADFVTVPQTIQAQKGVWTGAKVGLYSIKLAQNSPAGHVDADYFRFS